MKWIEIPLMSVLLIVCISQTTYSQSLIKPSEENICYSENSNCEDLWSEHELKLIIQEPDSEISNDQFIELAIENSTTDDDDVRIKYGIAKINNKTFDQNKSVELLFVIEIKNDTISEHDEVFNLKIHADSIFKAYDISVPITILSASDKDAEKTDLESKLDDLKMDATIDIGYFILTSTVTNIPVYKIDNGNFNETKLTVALKEINIHTSQGRIEHIILNCEGLSGFFECDFPISLTNLEANYGAPLRYVGPDEKFTNACVKLGSLFVYKRDTDKHHFPPNQKYSLTPDKPYCEVQLTESVLDYIDARSYTDILGLKGQENGLVQGEIYMSFIGNTQTRYNHKNAKYSHFTFAQYVNLNLSISKFDSKYDTLRLENDATIQDSSKSTLMPIIRRSNVSFNVEMNLFRYTRTHDFYLTLGHRVNLSYVSDTNGTHYIVNPFFYLQPGGFLNASPQLKCYFDLPILFNYTHDQNFYNFNHKWVIVLQPSIEVSYKPLNDQKEPGKSAYFIRIRYYDMPYKKSENFFQLQLGASVTLTELFKKE